MLNLTPLTRPYFAFLRRRMEAVGNPAATEAVQRRLLATLLHTARATAVGEKIHLCGSRFIRRFCPKAASCAI